MKIPSKIKLFFLIIFICFSINSNCQLILQTKLNNNLYNESPVPLTKTEISNLVVFSKIVGDVKYFYPVKETSKMDWELFISNGIKEIQNAENDEELIGRLNKLFTPISPSIKIFEKENTEKILNEYRSDLKNGNYKKSDKIQFWEHRGLGFDKSKLPFFTRILFFIHSSKLVRRRYSGKEMYLPEPHQPYIDTVDENISFLVPISVYSKEKKKFSLSIEKNNSLDLNLRSTKLANIIFFWNVIQHFHPYFEYFSEDWKAILPISLDLASQSTSKNDFIHVLKKMMAVTKDSHFFVSEAPIRGANKNNYVNKLDLDWVENKLVVSSIADNNPLCDLKRGDVILKINGFATDSLINNELQFSSSGNLMRKYKHTAKSILSSFDLNKNISLLISDKDNSQKEVILNLNQLNFIQKNIPITYIKELTSGVYYINISGIPWKLFKNKLHELEKAKGLIFDLREYPSPSFIKILRYLSPTPINLGGYLFRIIFRFPNHNYIQYDTLESRKLNPKKPYLAAPKIFLMGSETISFGETFIELIDYYNLGTIIGQNSAGANGDVNLSATSNFVIGWTGIKALKRNGQNFYGIGFQPKIIVNPTLNGLRERKDETIEKALKTLLNF